LPAPARIHREWRLTAGVDNGRLFPGFDDLRSELARRVKVPCVLDGEICCLDENGRSASIRCSGVGNVSVTSTRSTSCSSAVRTCAACLSIERKARLKRLIPRKPSRLLYVDHVETRGCELFQKVCLLDLEGIVAEDVASSRDG